MVVFPYNKLLGDDRAWKAGSFAYREPARFRMLFHCLNEKTLGGGLSVATAWVQAALPPVLHFRLRRNIDWRLQLEGGRIGKEEEERGARPSIHRKIYGQGLL